MKQTEVHTAISYSCDRNDLQEPLIDVSLDNDIEKHRSDVEGKTYTAAKQTQLFQYFRCVGFALGFFLQFISLGATALLVIQWGRNATLQTTQEKAMYYTLLGLSNSWLLLFPLVCIAIERSWTTKGVKYIQCRFLSEEDPQVTQQSRRMVFVAGVQFLAGIVLGCFLNWATIDLYLDASSEIFTTLFVSLVACLGFCYGMIVVHDTYAVEEDEMGLVWVSSPRQ